jgi:Na+/H+-dicarboxylate symporter
MNYLRQPLFLLLLALVAGIFTGLYPTAGIINTADAIATIFVNLLKLISLPIIFLAVVSTITQLEGHRELKTLGGHVVKYTLFTTVVAASVALGIFLWINPIASADQFELLEPGFTPQTGYWEYLLSSIPSNLITPFSEGNVIAILLLALLMSFAILSLPNEKRTYLNELFSNLFAAILEIAKLILKFIPIAIWAFITQFIIGFESTAQLTAIGLYIACVVIANAIQALIVLPALLRTKKISPWLAFKAMAPAINVAFFSKSSAATLPVTMNCAKENLGVKDKTAGFCLPLCTAVNMNACAGFITITVLFVAMSNGMTFSAFELVAWVLVASLVAIGNAGVPMGCYFLSLALLTTMNVPLNLMFVILPFFAILDMMETAINVWSDACVTAVVDKDLEAQS